MSIHIFRSLPLSADSRTKRNGIVFDSGSKNTKFYTWERSWVRGEVNKNHFPYSKTGNKISKTVKFIMFIFWVPFMVISKARKDDVVVLMDLETAILGIFAAKIRGCYVVFDIVDPCSQTKLHAFEKYGLNKYVDWLEIKYASYADMALIPHQCRIMYYEDRIGKKYSGINFQVVENVPSFKDKPISNNKIILDVITIGYFGTLDSNSRGLEFLISLAENYRGKIKVIIAGQGEMSYKLEKLSDEMENLYYLGSFNQDALVSLYDKVDYTWAFYSGHIPLHQYAAPNKFYEHLYFGKPIVTTEITPQSCLIRDLNSGVIIDDRVNCQFTEENVFNMLVNHYNLFNSNDRAKMLSYWEDNYADYYRKIGSKLIAVLDK